MEFEFRVKYDSNDLYQLYRVLQRGRNKWYRSFFKISRKLFKFCGGTIIILSCVQMLLWDGLDTKYLPYLLIGILCLLVDQLASPIERLCVTKYLAIMTYLAKKERIFHFSEQEMITSCGHTEDRLRYHEIINLLFCNDRYFLQINKLQFHVLPMRSLVSGDPAQFADFIQQKTGLTIQYLK